MDLFWHGIYDGFILLISGDPEVLRIACLSLIVTGSAIVISMLIGIPIGAFLALSEFPGKRFIISLINTGMGLPPVIVGLAIMILLWRSGPLGFLGMLYTPAAMVVAQVVISFPIVTGLSLTAIQQMDPKLKLQTISLGASRWQLFWTLVIEARLPLLAAVMAGFGGVISEVGAVMMVGGNIKGETRVLTTSILLESRMGHFETAIALGLVLLLLSFTVNLALTQIQQRTKKR